MSTPAAEAKAATAAAAAAALAASVQQKAEALSVELVSAAHARYRREYEEKLGAASASLAAAEDARIAQAMALQAALEADFEARVAREVDAYVAVTSQKVLAADFFKLRNEMAWRFAGWASPPETAEALREENSWLMRTLERLLRIDAEILSAAPLPGSRAPSHGGGLGNGHVMSAAVGAIAEDASLSGGAGGGEGEAPESSALIDAGGADGGGRYGTGGGYDPDAFDGDDGGEEGEGEDAPPPGPVDGDGGAEAAGAIHGLESGIPELGIPEPGIPQSGIPGSGIPESGIPGDDDEAFVADDPGGWADSTEYGDSADILRSPARHYGTAQRHPAARPQTANPRARPRATGGREPEAVEKLEACGVGAGRSALAHPRRPTTAPVRPTPPPPPPPPMAPLAQRPGVAAADALRAKRPLPGLAGRILAPPSPPPHPPIPRYSLPSADPCSGWLLPSPPKPRVYDAEIAPGGSIADAIARCGPGAAILLLPGIHRESVSLAATDAVGLYGRCRATLESESGPVLSSAAAAATVDGVAIRCLGGSSDTVVITGGGLRLVECEITSAADFKSSALVTIAGLESTPHLLNCKIHGGLSNGVSFHTGARGVIEGCEVWGNACVGVEIKTEADPTVVANQIFDGEEAGVIVHEKGRGTIERNNIFGNRLTGVAIQMGGDPVLIKNKIHDGLSSGVMVHSGGMGTIAENEIFGNALMGVDIGDGGDPVVEGNTIYENEWYGIYTRKGGMPASGKGRIGDNELYENRYGAIQAEASGEQSLGEMTGARFASLVAGLASAQESLG